MFKRYFIHSCVMILQTLPVHSYGQCDVNAIEFANRYYEIGKFYECIKSLNQCMQTNGSDRHKDFTKEMELETQAYRLLAECYLAIDSTNRADSVIDMLLSKINEDFEPDPGDPERFKIAV